MPLHTPHSGPTSPNKENINDLYQFFALRLEEMRKFGWSEEGIQEFHEYHHPHVLSDRLPDPTRFFRVVYNGKREIVGYFESKQHGTNEHTQVIQWIMVREDYRRRWIAKELYRAFEIWCRENNYTVTKSCTTTINEVSQKMHTTLGFEFVESEDSVLWFQKEFR